LQTDRLILAVARARVEIRGAILNINLIHNVFKSQFTLLNRSSRSTSLNASTIGLQPFLNYRKIKISFSAQLDCCHWPVVKKFCENALQERNALIVSVGEV